MQCVIISRAATNNYFSINLLINFLMNQFYQTVRLKLSLPSYMTMKIIKSSCLGCWKQQMFCLKKWLKRLTHCPNSCQLVFSCNYLSCKGQIKYTFINGLTVHQSCIFYQPLITRLSSSCTRSTFIYQKMFKGPSVQRVNYKHTQCKQRGMCLHSHCFCSLCVLNLWEVSSTEAS